MSNNTTWDVFFFSIIYFIPTTGAWIDQVSVQYTSHNNPKNWKVSAAAWYFVFEHDVLQNVDDTGSTISTLLHDRINPKDCQVLSLGDTGFLQFFRVVSRDYGKPRDIILWGGFYHLKECWINTSWLVNLPPLTYPPPRNKCLIRPY